MKILRFLKETYNKKAFLFYATRWQLSTPVFLILPILLWKLPYWEIILIGNLVGATIFFPIDKYIIQRNKK